VETIKATNPSTGEVIKEIHRTPPVEVEKTMKEAKLSFPSWRDLGVKKRIGYLTKMRKNLLDNLDGYSEIISRATGKSLTESLMSDLLPTIDMIHYYEKNAKEFLSREKRKTPLAFQHCTSYVEYRPVGVVAIISPWNFPFQLSMVPVATALVAGNTVVIKPSNVTPAVGELIESIAIQIGLPQGVLTVVQGGREVVQKMIEEKPEKIFFTGSVATGRKIMEQASKHLIPVELELGGKDPMIILKDADVERAVEGALYGAFANSGQICIGVERVYVEEPVYEEFIKKLLKRVRELRLGEGKDVDLGAMTNPDQISVVKEQVEDAVQKGAVLHEPLRIEGNYVYPLIITNVDHTMKVMTEETFGPLMPVMAVKDEEEALMMANDSIYGLNGSVWTKNIKKGKALASRMESGNVMVNDVLKNVGNPDLPFGGVKQSGIGRYHGPEGIRSFTHSVSIMVNDNKAKKEVNWFPYTAEKYELVKGLLETLHGEMNPVTKGKELIKLMKKMKRMDD